MDNQDKKNFKSLFDSMAGYYGKPELTQDILKMYFEDLECFSFEQVAQAANKHRRDTKHGQFYPKVADLIKHLGGGELTADSIISAARLKKSPLGILCAIQIGTLSLNSGDPFHLKQKAEECLQLLPEWREKALGGNYSDHELSIMVKYDVDPCQPLAIGIEQPSSAHELRLRVEMIKDTPRHKELLERPYSEPTETPEVSREGLKRIASELRIIENKVNPD